MRFSSSPLSLFLLIALSLLLALTGCTEPEPMPERPQGEVELDDINDQDGNDGDDDPVVEEPPPEGVPLLLIGMDGFKPSYLLDDRYGPTPNFDRLREGGVRAESLKPVFPSKTFVNLYSIVTGLYPENHGIVGNTVFDPELNAFLRMSDSFAQQQSAWWGGEPIWVTAEKAGLSAGTFFWVGSEALIHNTRPSYWIEYDSRVTHTDRIDTVLGWLTDDENPVRFGSLYFASPDGAGHSHGTESNQVANAVRQMDRHLGRIIEGLEEAGVWPDIHLLIVSDHGMVDTDEEKVIVLDDLINLSHVQMVEFNPVAMMNPRSGRLEEVYQALKENEENYKVYLKEDLPERYRLKNSHRTPEIIMIADMPYTITTRSFFEDRGLLSGNHGYDPEYPEMHGVFLAHGPAFHSGVETETLKLVDIYALMAHLLGLEAAPNDGSLERIGSQVLRDFPPSSEDGLDDE